MVGIKILRGILYAVYSIAFLLSCELLSSAALPTNANVVVTLSDPLLSLGAPVWTNGHSQIEVRGETGINYTVESSTNLIAWTPFATNSGSSVISVSAPQNPGFYRASRGVVPLFKYALAAQGNIELVGNGINIDSFSSVDTNQSSDGFYNGYSGTNGNVASSAGLVGIGNATVKGNLYLGTGADFGISSGGVITGTVFTNFAVRFPDVNLPVTNANGSPIVWIPAPVVPKASSFLHYFTTNGYYVVTDSLPILVESNITAYLDVKTSSFAPSSISINGGATNSGTIVMYQESGSAVLNNNASSGPTANRARNFVYLGMPGVTNLSLPGYPIYVGTIYAPESNLFFSGGGSSQDYSGSFIADSIHVNGHFSFHFDESLLSSGPFR